MEGNYKHLNVDHLTIMGLPLMDPSTTKVHARWLSPQPTNAKPPRRRAYGKYSRKDISVGHIHLEVAENGVLVQLIKDHVVFAQRDEAPVTVGHRHRLTDGIWYILTNTENAIMEVDVTIETQWDPHRKLGPDIRKYILVKRNIS
tara:strand:- start:2066 stop:2500 length:435 start_codon:yes stop_codon:yes gene_type:complete